MKLALFPPVEPERLEKIERAAAPMRAVNCADEEQAAEETADADAFFGKMTPRILARARKLRWVQAPTASLEHYLFPELIAHPLELTNMRGLFPDNIADHAFGCMLCFARNLHRYIRQQERREWRPYGGRKKGQQFRSGPAVTTPVDLAHTTLAGAALGVVGLGSIGAEIARRGVCFGMSARAVDALPRETPPGVEAVWPPDRLHDLLEWSDYVVIAAPHTPQTEGLFRKPLFARMKSSAVLINIGRGAIVDLDDLTAALRGGEIAGAALDVFEIEPLPAEHPLWGFDNAILTPHVAGHSPRIAERHLQVIVENAGRFVRGEPLKNIVDKRRWF